MKAALPLVLSLLLVPALAGAQAPTLSISGASFRPVPLAYPAPLGDATARADFDAAMQFDLAACGLFQVLDRKGYLADKAEGATAAGINFQRWGDVGAEMLVKVSLTGGGDATTGELRLFTVGSGREALKATATGAPRRVAHELADQLYRHLTREPGPFLSRIAYVRKAGQNRDVYAADWDGQGAQKLTQGGINLLPAVGPEGAVGFTSYRRGRPDLFVATGSTARPVVTSGQMATGIAFSPDGRRIAYSQAQGEGAQIWIANADGSGARAITDTPYGLNTSPAWSPDGKRLAFVSNRGGSPQVYVMNADGTGARRLTFQGNYNQTPDWSPRGDLIAFTARDERNAFDIFTVNVETGKITRLTQDQANNEEPAFSPNGRLVLFTSNRSGSQQLWVMTADGNNPVMLPVERGAYLTPDWGR